jgi:hypothetical protein
MNSFSARVVTARNYHHQRQDGFRRTFQPWRCALVHYRILRCRPAEDSSIGLVPDQSPRVTQKKNKTYELKYRFLFRTNEQTNELELAAWGGASIGFSPSDHLRCPSAALLNGTFF